MTQGRLNNFEREENVEGLTLTDFKSCHEATIIKVWLCYQHGDVYTWKTMERSEINTYVYS